MNQIATRFKGLVVGLVLALALPVTAAHAGGGQDLLPVVFVHGSSGSAAQFQTHAMRFTSNGYPQDLLYAFEYDTGPSFSENGPEVLAQLDAFLTEVLEETGADGVNTIGHSRGTTVMTAYLNGIEGGSDKVARYVNIDGRAMPELPGGVPTIGIWGEWNSGAERAQIGPDPDDNYYFPEKSHTEVATSAEAFGLMYEFFTGRAPKTTDVVPEPPGRVTIAGRVTLFPQNAGYEGATLDIWRVDADTGYRVGRRPVHSTVMDASGRFGPVRVNGRKSYELAVTRPSGSVHHFYQEPFARSDHFLRLQTSPEGTGIGSYIPTSDAHVALNVIRQRELWGDQGHLSDQLTIDGLEVLTETISPRSNVIISLFAFDSGTQGTDLGAGVPMPFGFIPFLTAADVYIPATTPPTGIVEVALTSRDADRRAVVNVPNWASSNHRISVQFRDHVQDEYGFTEYKRARIREHIRQYLHRVFEKLRHR